MSMQRFTGSYADQSKTVQSFRDLQLVKILCVILEEEKQKRILGEDQQCAEEEQRRSSVLERSSGGRWSGAAGRGPEDSSSPASRVKRAVREDRPSPPASRNPRSGPRTHSPRSPVLFDAVDLVVGDQGVFNKR